jgi:FMN phosphatase YigB (HAD superfamily)
LIENDKPSYKEPPKEISFYAYKRINHFREILSQFQAKESTDIPPSVIEIIQNQIKKERIQLTNLTNKKMKEILKKLGYNRYYEHIPFIKDKLGIKPPVMTPQLEERLCNMFIEIQGPYAKYCPEDRVNFLNYYYTVYKLCELLDQKTFLPFFPMLKDREKRIEQDEIWKNICKDLDWEFIPTL